MRKLLLVLAAAVMLPGCISTLDGAYDDQARRQCENGPAAERGDCLDRVDRHRQSRN
ncbi:MAG: hypothetical protein WDM79_15165 [Terricaulis sp.]